MLSFLQSYLNYVTPWNRQAVYYNSHFRDDKKNGQGGKVTPKIMQSVVRRMGFALLTSYPVLFVQKNQDMCSVGNRAGGSYQQLCLRSGCSYQPPLLAQVYQPQALAMRLPESSSVELLCEAREDRDAPGAEVLPGSVPPMPLLVYCIQDLC